MLARLPFRRIEVADRRVLGALQFVDAVTGLPAGVAAPVEVRGAEINGTPIEASLDERTVRLRQSRGGFVVIFSAPLFGSYTDTFDSPAPPPQTVPNPLRLRFALTDAGPSYLPQEFFVDLPRALNPDAADSVLSPQPVGLLRTPNAGVLDGWAVLRVRVTQSGTNPPLPLPGVLLRVFRLPRTPGDRPIGLGMTEWRGGVRGEALVPVAGIQRFRPGSGPHVIETDQAIEIEATRDSAFTGDLAVVPNVSALVAGDGAGVIRPPVRPPASSLELLRPDTPPPLRVQAGREYVVHLAMP